MICKHVDLCTASAPRRAEPGFSALLFHACQLSSLLMADPLLCHLKYTFTLMRNRPPVIAANAGHWCWSLVLVAGAGRCCWSLPPWMLLLVLDADTALSRQRRHDG